MREKERRNYWGRSNVAAALRAASQELSRAIENAEKPPESSPLAESLQKVKAKIESAIEWERIYISGHKKIANALAKEKKAIDALLQQVVEMPVTKTEKTLAKRKKKEAIL